MVRITPLASPRFELGDEREFAPVVHAAFGQRRKMLRNNLGRHVEARFGAGSCERVLAAAGISGNVRPEELGLAEFAALTRAVVAERDAMTANAQLRSAAGGGQARPAPVGHGAFGEHEDAAAATDCADLDAADGASGGRGAGTS